MSCKCPMYCKYCGALRKLDSVGHYCGTKNCQWEHGFKMCALKAYGIEIEKEKAGD